MLVVNDNNMYLILNKIFIMLINGIMIWCWLIKFCLIIFYKILKVILVIYFI